MSVDDATGAGVRVLRDDADGAVIALDGELDLASVGSVRQGIEPLLSRGPRQVTFDLGRLTFMDSTGIALLVQVSNRVGELTLTDVQPIVHRILGATGLLERFGLTP